GIAVLSRHRAASEYTLPSERSDAASHATSNHGWCSSIWINLCPTTPVAPRIPISIFFIRYLGFYNTRGFTRLITEHESHSHANASRELSQGVVIFECLVCRVNIRRADQNSSSRRRVASG